MGLGLLLLLLLLLMGLGVLWLPRLGLWVMGLEWWWRRWLL